MRKKVQRNEKFYDYWRGLSRKDKARIAKLCGTTIPYLQQFATGYAVLSADMAGRLEHATHTLRIGQPRFLREAFTVFKRGELCETCAGCEYYQNNIY